MPPFGLVGPAYASQSINADCQICRNWYVENMEAANPKSPKVLYPTPGLKLFASIIQPNARSIRGQFAINDRLFVVAGSQLLEFLWHPDIGIGGTVETITRGTVADDRMPVSMAGSPQQLLVASAGMAYVLNMATNVVTPVQIPNAAGRLISKVGYSDSFFNALVADSQQWFISKSFDALTWDPLDTTIISVFPDNAVSTIVDHRKIWFFGQGHTVVYYISGNVFPYDVLDPIIEQGCIAKNSPAQLDNSVFWLGGDERGAGIVWRAQGQTPMRISNHAIEFAMQGYPTMTDAISYTYQDQGHSFYVLYFPTASKTWVYDVATNNWHERDYFDAGVSIAHRSQNHTFIFGKHLVGDWKTASLYEMNIKFLDDFGNPIRRVRRAPHIAKDNKVLRYTKLEIILESGLGTPDIQDVGPPGSLGFVFNQLAADNFLRANENPLAAPWASLNVFGTGHPLELNAHAVTPTAITPNIYASIYTGVIWGDGQSSQAVLKSLVPGSGYATLVLRGTPAGDFYYIGLDASTGFGGVGRSTPVHVWKLQGGVLTIFNIGYFTPQLNDVWKASIAGTTISVYQNGSLLGTVTDPNPIFSGSPGLLLQPSATTLITDLSWGSWAGEGAQLEITGTGPGVTRPPKLNMRYSNDYGHTWSNEQTRSAGLGGEYRKRVVFWRMGRARDRVIEINCSDKIPWRIISDNMEVTPGDGA